MPPPRLMEQVRGEIRARHYSRRSEDAYVHWIRRFIVFHGRRHPRELAAAEIAAFITWLAVDQHVAASTQNQALSGILFSVQGSAPPRDRRGDRAAACACRYASRSC
jgi:Phage integrase, N-terminal SAM-like domain